MLRKTTLALGAVMLVAAILGLARHWRPWLMIELGLFGVLIIAGTLFEKHYKKSTPPKLEPGWIDTGERFIDPETGKLTVVYWKPETGERYYSSQ